jgi:hypothetical protein
MSIFASIGLWLISFFTSAPVQMILKSVLQDLLQSVVSKAAPAVMDAVKAAMLDDKLSGTEKFDQIQASVMAQFPTLEKSVLNSLIENAYNTLKKQVN